MPSVISSDFSVTGHNGSSQGSLLWVENFLSWKRKSCAHYTSFFVISMLTIMFLFFPVSNKIKSHLHYTFAQVF